MKNWDKPSVLAVILGAGALILWYSFAPKYTAPAPQQSAVNETTAAAATTQAAVPSVVIAAEPAEMDLITLNGSKMTYAIQPVSGTVEKVTFRDNILKNDRSGALEITNTFPALASRSNAYKALGIRSELGDLTTIKVLENRADEKSCTLRRLVKDSTNREFIIEENFAAADNYRLDVTINIINASANPQQIPGLIISAGDLSPWHRISGDQKSSSQEIHKVEYCTAANKVKDEDAIADSDDWEELNNVKVRWAGVTNRFFAQLLQVNADARLHAERVESPAGSGEYSIHTAAKLDPFVLAPQSAKTFKVNYFLGPKSPKNLTAFHSEASEVMHLGWFPIDFLAFIMLWLLNTIYGFIGSFGVSIIVLTLLIRTLFFPVTMKANASMREMSALSPELKAIREKYKDEPMVAQAKMQELYRTHKVNPMSGCLPMLIQIPVFIALYYALGSAAELRQQSFLWIKDLAQPDTVATVFGLAINPLIIVWTLLMVVQQKLTPTAMDPMQAKVMLAMPLVMLFFLYKLPAALTLYWSVSQIFSIAQMLYQNKLKKREEAQRQSGQDKPQGKPRTVRS